MWSTFIYFINASHWGGQIFWLAYLNNIHWMNRLKTRLVCPKYHCRVSGCCVHDMVVWIGGMKLVGRCRWSCLPNFSHLAPLPFFFLRTLSGVSRECEKTTLFTVDGMGVVGWASLSGVTYSSLTQFQKMRPSVVGTWRVSLRQAEKRYSFLLARRLSFRFVGVGVVR